MPSQKELNELFEYKEADGTLVRKYSIGNRRHGTVIGAGKAFKPVSVTIAKRSFLVHRVIWTMVNGPIPQGMVIDHIDHNPSNNRIENLRLVSSEINARNLPLKKNNTSGVTGVYWRQDKRKWCAEIWVHYTKTFLGYFDDLEQAKACRKHADTLNGFHANHGDNLVVDLR